MDGIEKMIASMELLAEHNSDLTKYCNELQNKIESLEGQKNHGENLQASEILKELEKLKIENTNAIARVEILKSKLNESSEIIAQLVALQTKGV